MNVMTAFHNLESHGWHRAPEVIRHEAALLEKRRARIGQLLPPAQDRAEADLPALWRKVVQRLHMEEETPQQTAAVVKPSAEEVSCTAEVARACLHQRLHEASQAPDSVEAALADALARTAHIPQPLEDHDRIAAAMAAHMAKRAWPSTPVTERR